MMHEDETQNAQPTPPEQPQQTPRWCDQEKDEGPIEIPAVEPTGDTRLPISPPAGK